MFLGLNMDDQHHQGFELANTNHALLAVVIALVFKQNHRPAENLFGISEIKAVLCQIGQPFGFVPSEIHGLDYADKNTHGNNLNISCHPAFGRAKVPTSPICGAGAQNTVSDSEVYTATLSAVSLRPKFMVLDVKVLPIRKDGSMAESMFCPPSRPFCASQKRPEWFFKSHSGAETMTTVNTTPTGKSAQTTPTGRNAQTLELSFAATYALSKQIPDLADRGCTIGTAYGDINIPPGRMAARLAEWLHREISRGGLQ